MLAYVFDSVRRSRSREDLARGLLKSGRKSRARHIDAVAAKRHALGYEVGSLRRSLRQRAIGTDHAPPGKVGVVALEEDRAGEARGAWGDIAVGADKTRWDLAHAGEDFK